MDGRIFRASRNCSLKGVAEIDTLTEGLWASMPRGWAASYHQTRAR